MHTPEANSYSCNTLIELLPPKKKLKNKDFCTKKKNTHTKRKTLKCQKVEAAGYSNRIGTEKADRALHEGVPAIYVHHRCCVSLLCVTFFLSYTQKKKCNAPLTRGRNKKLAVLFLAQLTEKGRKTTTAGLQPRGRDEAHHEPRRSSLLKKRHYYKTHT
jgi:hypothetical protein